MRRTPRVISDALWERIRPWLPVRARNPKGGRPWIDDRECLEGALWLLRTGARYRDIPVDLPSGPTVWRRMQEWSGEGCLGDIQAELINELADAGKLDLSELVMDATFIRGKKGVMTLATPSVARG